MTGSSTRRVPLAAVLGLLLITASTAGAQGISLKASAGLAGHVRPGRWTPVRVDVASASRPVNGDVVVEWGPTRVHRAISLAPGQARHLELYARTLDPRDVITVRLAGEGTSLAEVEVPVHVVPNDPAVPPLVVCGPRALASDRSCVAGVDVLSLPHSWRGFDAADDVRLSDSEIAALDVAQRDALALASSQARLLRLGLGAPTIGPVPTERRRAQRSTALLGGYAIAFILLLFATRYRHASATLIALVTISALGSVAVIAAGRIGPGAVILVHHASSIDQYEGAESAIVTLRGVVEFPALGHYTLRSEIEDATILVNSMGSAHIARIDESGFSTLSGSFGLGATTAFVLEGASSPTLLRVAREGQAVRVTNISNLTLNRCGFATTPPAMTVDLSPGGSLAGPISETDADPTFNCILESSPWGFSEPRHPIEMNGHTAVVVHLNPEPGGTALRIPPYEHESGGTALRIPPYEHEPGGTALRIPLYEHEPGGAASRISSYQHVAPGTDR
jgi:hypothetical protein